MTVGEVLGWLGIAYLAGMATILALDLYGRVTAKRRLARERGL
jgi:hypothetical protein